MLILVKGVCLTRQRSDMESKALIIHRMNRYIKVKCFKHLLCVTNCEFAADVKVTSIYEESIPQEAVTV